MRNEDIRPKMQEYNNQNKPVSSRASGTSSQNELSQDFSTVSSRINSTGNNPQISTWKHRIYRVIILLIMVIVGTVGGYHLIIQSDLFLLEEISVIGNHRISAEAIISASGARIGIDNINSLSGEIIERRIIQKFSYISQLQTSRQMPKTLIIKVAEHVPVAAIPLETASGTIYGLVNIDGTLLELLDSLESLNAMNAVNRRMEANGGERMEAKPREADDAPPRGHREADGFSYPTMMQLTGVIQSDTKSIDISFALAKLFVPHAGFNGYSVKENWSVKFPILLGTQSAAYLHEKFNPKILTLAVKTLRNIRDIIPDAYADIVCINASNPKKTSLQLQNGAVVWLSADYLVEGLRNFHTVFHELQLAKQSREVEEEYKYMDARFNNMVYCGGKSRKARKPESQKAGKRH